MCKRDTRSVASGRLWGPRDYRWMSNRGEMILNEERLCEKGEMRSRDILSTMRETRGN